MTMAVLGHFGHFGDVRRWLAGADYLERIESAQSWRNVNGVFAETGGNWIAVLRDGDLLIARPGEHRYFSEIELVDVIPSVPGTSEAHVRFGDASVWPMIYAVSGSLCGESDPTPFAEPQDSDFGEYLRYLVAGGAERQDRLFPRDR